MLRSVITVVKGIFFNNPLALSSLMGTCCIKGCTLTITSGRCLSSPRITFLFNMQKHHNIVELEKFYKNRTTNTAQSSYVGHVGNWKQLTSMWEPLKYIKALKIWKIHNLPSSHSQQLFVTLPCFRPRCLPASSTLENIFTLRSVIEQAKADGP